MKHPKEILFVCNTPFQIVVATHIAFSFYRTEHVDIIISDHIAGAEKLLSGIRASGFFRHSMLVHNKKTIFHGSKIRYQLSRMGEIIKNICLVRRISAGVHYDEILFSNISIFTILLYNRLLRSNPNIELGLFEEGMSTYTRLYADGDSPKTLHRRFINSTGILASTKHLYLFRPELLQWKLPVGEIRTLPMIDRTNQSFMDVINHIFDVEHLEDDYSQSVIFFEEAFYADGIEINDVEIVEQIATLVGRENIFVKLHPRNPHNRFAALGYATSKSQHIPWEVIMLNRPMENKTLITISSGSVIYPYLYCGIESPSISLLDTLPVAPGWMKSDIGKMMRQIYATYPNIYLHPLKMDELNQLIC